MSEQFSPLMASTLRFSFGFLPIRYPRCLFINEGMMCCILIVCAFAKNMLLPRDVSAVALVEVKSCHFLGVD